MAIWNVPLDGGRPWRTTLKAERAERRYPVARPRHAVEASGETEAIRVARAWQQHGELFTMRNGVPVGRAAS